MNLQNLLGRLTGGNPQVCDRYRCELEAVYRRVAEADQVGRSQRGQYEKLPILEIYLFLGALCRGIAPRPADAAFETTYVLCV